MSQQLLVPNFYRIEEAAAKTAPAVPAANAAAAPAAIAAAADGIAAAAAAAQARMVRHQCESGGHANSINVTILHLRNGGRKEVAEMIRTSLLQIGFAIRNQY